MELEHEHERSSPPPEERGTATRHAGATGWSVRMRQVLSNLLRNAAEASPRGSVITVTGRSRTGGYRIVVRDRGLGIPPDSLGRVFEPFFSLRRGGSGLGLAVCHGLIMAHGGSIEARSPEGGGTELVVDLVAGPGVTTR